MSKNKNGDLIKNENNISVLIENDGQILYNKISSLIEQSHREIYARASQ